MNPGQKVLERLYTRDLQCDPEWSLRSEKAFTWWPAQHAQTIQIEKEVSGPDGAKGYVVTIETDFLKEVKNRNPETELLVKTMMNFCTMASPLWIPEKGEIRLASQMLVNESTWEWGSSLLSQAALLQIFEAKTLANQSAEAIGAKNWISGPELGRIRENYDEMASLVETLFLPLGKTAGVWKEEEFSETVEKYMNKPPCILGTGGGSGLTGEFVFGEQTSLLRMHGDQKHPRMGNGLLITQTFPVAPMSETELFAHAVHLNLLEMAEGPWGYGFGSYRPKNNFLVHSAFFPNSSYQRGLIRNFYFGAAWRAREISKHFTNTDWTEETISRVQKKKAQALDVALEKIQQKDRFRFRP